MALLELENIHAYYGHIHALKGVSLRVEEGEIVTLIGANGAGKSTTLRTISGLIHAREGIGAPGRARISPAWPRMRSWRQAWGMCPKGAVSSRA